MIIDLLQVIVALGLLNVWVLRARSATSFRGGDAASMKEEFEIYGLPPAMLYVVGGLKISCALALLAGLWFPALTLPAAAIISALMLGAIVMHLKVNDAPVKSLPAALVLIMSVAMIAPAFI